MKQNTASNAIATRARAMSADRSQGKHLRFVPIRGQSAIAPKYELLRPETLARVIVTEISEAGCVAELSVKNLLDVPVFLMDGQELIGAKQNRILNTDVFVPRKSKLKIPVSCVEAGRWGYVGAAFSAGKAASHHVRAAKLQRVHENLRSRGQHDADQGAVWDEVAQSIAHANVNSPTSALSDAYTARHEDLQRFRNDLRLPDVAVGVAVFSGQQFQGLDLFDRHSTLQFFWESIVDSYAVDLMNEPVDPANPATDDGRVVRDMLEQAAGASWERFDSPGQGKEWRLSHGGIAGAALVWNARVVLHLQLFPESTSPEPSEPLIIY